MERSPRSPSPEERLSVGVSCGAGQGEWTLSKRWGGGLGRVPGGADGSRRTTVFEGTDSWAVRAKGLSSWSGRESNPYGPPWMCST